MQSKMILYRLVDFHTQAELEAHAKEIVDDNVLNFLQIFIVDLEV